jgi:hypothetical protein|tara:strand:+ start:130 stop:804 length:675 start_codon:yes stop_codon:yes gene_type:complete
MAYQGSPNSYFKQLPNLSYPSLANERNSAYDYQVVKNLFKRAVLRDDVINEITNFTRYSVQGDERADQIAYNFYGDSGLDWIILTTNNIVHVRDEWPMSNRDFLTYLNQKYTSEQLSNVHHYETREIRDSSNTLIQKAGVRVKSDHSVTYLDQGSAITTSSIKTVSYLQHETDLNDAKRNILILQKEYLSTILRDIGDIMQYKESQQYINDGLKQTENPRIISP